MSEAATLYGALVIERARRPLHDGETDPADGAADGTNPICGDRVHVTVRFAADGTVAEVRHRTRACAICAACADQMAARVRGAAVGEVLSLKTSFERLLEDGPSDLDPAMRDGLGSLNAFAELHEYRSRRKCATLPWTALVAALDRQEER